MNLKELRVSKKLTQTACANILNIPLRTYSRYENDESRIDTPKYNYMISILQEYGKVDEEHGILEINDIIKISTPIFKEFNVEFCYLFGSYAKKKATEKSDIDLFIVMPLNGLKFYELVEVLREKLHKKIDLLDDSQLSNNPSLALEILRDGVKIYHRDK